MNQILEQIVQTGLTTLPSGEAVQVTSHIDPQCGKLLQDIIRETRPQSCLEVGLAFGISTLYILDALSGIPGSKLIGMDPAQHDNYWRGAGLHNVERSGHRSLYEFYEQPSEQLLPTLVQRGLKIQFAFIDGWHTFDHALVDFFYIDQMLNSGGVIVLDDVAYPAIKRVCDFVVSNRNYTIRNSVAHNVTNKNKLWLKALLVKAFHPLIRTDKTPSKEVQEKELQLRDIRFVALTKSANDSRMWDHFVQF